MHLKKFLRIGLIAFLLAVLLVPVLPVSPVYASFLDRTVSGSTNDCYVGYHTSAWSFSLTDHQTAGYYSASYIKRGGGMRFQNIIIPQGSTITSAYITFTASDSHDAVTVNTVLVGEDVDDAATFSDIADYQARRGTVVGGTNNDYLTTASVNWNNVAAWTAESTYQSASIVTIIQEIVNRVGWSSGNDMVIWWDDHAGNSSAESMAMRQGYSYDITPAKAPILHLEYTGAGSGGPIDIGSAATDRAGTSGYGYTRVLLDNPANTDGKITSIQIYASGNIADLKVGTFYGSGGSYTNRDYVDLGAVPSGDHTYTTNVLEQDLAIETKTGDYIGFWHEDSGVDEDSSGGAGVYYRIGDWMAGKYGGAQTYTLAASHIISVYATGTQLDTVGSDPISTEADASSPGRTRLDTNNPSDKSGTITSVEVWSQNALTNLRVGTFYGSGTSWTIRDYEDLGAVATGNQVVDELSIDIQPGDIIGHYFTTAGDVTGIYEPSPACGADGNGILHLWDNWVLSGGAKTYTHAPNFRDSIQGTIAATGAPLVTTDSATSITTSSAQLNGTIDSTGGYEITSRGFYWGLTTGYGNTYTDEGSYGTGAFNTSLSSLASSTTYHYKAWATNSQGTSTGANQHFVTSTSGSGEVTPYEGYSYAQQFTITGSTGGTGAGIQMPLHIYKGTGSSSGSSVYLGNNCSNFPNDIIFTSTGGTTVLPFWQETSSTTDVWVWVRIPFIPAYPATTYGFISYGNPSVTTSLSNGAETFIFFDSFSLSGGGELYNEGTPVIANEAAGTIGQQLGTHSEVFVNGVWHAYYEGMLNDGSLNPAVVFHATSTDGKNWTKDPDNPVIGMVAGTHTAAGVGDPSVIYKDGVFYLYVDATPARGGDEHDYIMLFTSTDGFTFTLQKDDILQAGSARILSDHVEMWDPTANLWRLWYADWTGGTGPVSYALTSTDGLNWNFGSRAQVGFPISVTFPLISQVFQYQDTYYMIYFTPKLPARVIIASSPDAASWTTFRSNWCDGFDSKLDRIDDTHWLYYHSTDTYDREDYNAYILTTITGMDFTGLASITGGTDLSADPAWTNYIGSSASITNYALRVVKSNQLDKGVQYINQLPATCVIGWKMTDYSSAASTYATGSILDRSGTGTFTSEASLQQENDGGIVGYVKSPEDRTVIGAGSLYTQYDYILEIQSTTTVAALVRGFSPISLTRTSSPSNFLHFGISGVNSNFSVDDVFIGNIVTPNPTITSWAGGAVQYNAVITDAASSIQLTSVVLHGRVVSILSGDTIDQLGFDYGTTTTYGTSWTNTVGSYSLGPFSSDTINGLTGGQTYHFRAKMHDSTAGTWTYGGDRTFTTTPTNVPIVTTSPAAGRTTTTATLQGTLESLGDYSSVYISFQWGPSASFGFTTVEETRTSVGGFNKEISGLQPDTGYYFRAVVRYSSTGYVYGTSQAFRTTGGAVTPGITPPSTLLIADVRIFSGFIESGDILIVSTYQLLYDVTPVEVVGDYFVVRIMEGEVLKCQGIPSNWGYRPTSIYQAPGHPLTWGSSYTEYLVGRADKWDTPPEATYAIGPGSWIGSDMSLLDNWVLATASRIGTYYGRDLVVYIPGYGQQLTTEGGKIFEEAIPGLGAIRPGLFSSGARAIIIDDTIREAAYEDTLDPEDKLGEDIMEHFDDLGATVGLEGGIVGMAFWMILCLIAIGGITAVSGSATVGILVALPLLFGGVYLGLVSLSIVIVIAVLAVIYLLWIKVVQGV